MFRNLFLKKSLFTICITTSISNFAFASEYDEDHAICGHKVEDSLALRQQAATNVYWESSTASNPIDWVNFKILGFNDFHGQLEQRTLFGRPVGGAAVLASYFDAEDEASENGTLIVHAGDHVGATPPISALLQDEPSISFLNLLSNGDCELKEHDDVTTYDPECNLVGTLGNHEFDEGVAEMKRLINGGIHANGPFLDDEFSGAEFPYVVANVVYEDTGKTIFPPYVIKEVEGIPIAFIGAILTSTPTIVIPSGVAGLKFLDEAMAINSYIPELQAQGVRAIVVTIHQGTRQRFFSGATGPDPTDVGGDIGPIIQALDDEIDIVVAGHWHQFTNALMNNNNGKTILVTQAFSRSTSYADIDVALDPISHDIVMKSAEIVTTWADEGPGLTPDSDVTELVNQAALLVAPLVNQVIATASIDVLRTTNVAGESALGNLIADAQRVAMASDIGFMNSGGIRSDLLQGQVTWGELFNVQPFNNDLVRMDLTGQQVIDVLNQQWLGQTRARIMKTSGITYTWADGDGDAATLADNRVIETSVLISGVPVDVNAVYSVTVNSFMASGGSNFSIFPQGVNRVVGPVDLDAFISYVASLAQPFSAVIEGRILRN
ncbi:5'-nucleotidase [hydrothermal vent metagenome]|uniref:5'-nucleotidase n=1 Tax=hydrothermal vent metagenome TaxID=652676 RepID=A0A3B1A7D0_9ZZZZ